MCTTSSATSRREGTNLSCDQDDRDERGRTAKAPGGIPLKGLRDVFWRVVESAVRDRVTLIAAGVTYFLLLSLFPALSALVAVYGFIADPATIVDHLALLSAILPPGAFDLIAGQLTVLARQKASTLSIAFSGSLLVAAWSANSGMKALVDAMNIAYKEDEKRGFFRLNLLSFSATIAALAVAALMISAVGVLPVVLKYLWLDRWQEALARLARWPVVLMLMMGAISLIYRFGPSRERAKMRWVTWGAAFSAFLWLGTSFCFAFYLENFANYNVTYGALGAVIGLMVWLWLSIIVLILGAEINAELEHQTRCDSTTGAPEPMGKRGAFVADTLGEAAD